MILWLDPSFGASGDMMLGTLIGLGADIDEIRAGLDGLGIDGWSVEREDVTRNSLSAVRAVVETADDHHHRSWSSIDGLLADASLPAAVATGARSTFRRLAEVEARMHAIDVDSVHFHEVGAIDAIVDIVGSWLAIDSLAVERVVVGPVGIGHGSVEAAHGTLPLPAPATASLLEGVPVRPLATGAETVTPTGAALLVTMADDWGPLPAGTLEATARGAGGRDPDGHPNVLTGHLLSEADRDQPLDALGPAASGAERGAAVVLETNLDDITPEVVAHVIGRCLDAGADDAWAVPIVMKKGRPGFELRVLCRPEAVAAFEELVFAETGTLGIRVRPVAKDMLVRRVETITVRGHAVRVKVGPHRAKPEHDDLVAAAKALEVPLRILAEEAVAAASRLPSSEVRGSEPDS